jgi:hypothetical protein
MERRERRFRFEHDRRRRQLRRVAEYNIVPTQPVQTATGNDITTLQIRNGHVASGGLPGGAFSSSLVLNDAPADAGGTATWTGSVPTTLQPISAVMLKQ